MGLGKKEPATGGLRQGVRTDEEPLGYPAKGGGVAVVWPLAQRRTHSLLLSAIFRLPHNCCLLRKKQEVEPVELSALRSKPHTRFLRHLFSGLVEGRSDRAGSQA